MILQVAQLPNLKVAAVLLTSAFFYDIFFVFVSPYVFDQSVMIQVATGGQNNVEVRDTNTGNEYCEDFCSFHSESDRCPDHEALPMLFGDPTQTLRVARDLPLPPHAHVALDELEQTMETARAMAGDSPLLDAMTLDLGELRGFEYYTGMRVSAFVKGAGGPVLRGGRYNALVERYGRKAFATGFAVQFMQLHVPLPVSAAFSSSFAAFLSRPLQAPW